MNDTPGPAQAEPALENLKIYIIQAKMDAKQISDLVELVSISGAISCNDPLESEVVITVISMRQRLERHIGWAIAKTKAVVTPNWLFDSVSAGKPMPCGDYAALESLHDTSVANCPESSFHAHNKFKPSSSGHQAVPVQGPSNQAHFPPYTVAELVPGCSNLNYRAKYACQRASPLVSPNQTLVGELVMIKRSRELEGEDRSALSYQKAISVLKGLPWKIKEADVLGDLPFIGPKLQGLILEFLDKGVISDAQRISQSERFQTLSLFNSVYGIGPSTSRRLYSLGLRTLDDLLLYYDVNSHEEDDKKISMSPPKPVNTDLSIRESLRLYHDLQEKIPRQEVEIIGDVVYRELENILPGCQYTIVGGYRRGKLECNDVDIVFTHPERGEEKGLCKTLVECLRMLGIVTHVMYHASFRSSAAARNVRRDTLEKIFTVFRLPPHLIPTSRSIHRRVDLIFAPYNVYWCAVIGWTGSIMFERDLRRWSEERKGWKFDSSGITQISNNNAIYANSEQDVFDLLELQWVDPELRNADA